MHVFLAVLDTVLLFFSVIFGVLSITMPPELVSVRPPALPDDEEELTGADPKFRTVPSGSPLLLLLVSSSVMSEHTFLNVHSILKHEDDDDELLELDEEEELLELDEDDDEELLELDDEEEELLLELLDDEEELDEELEEELDELEEELDDELEEELDDELEEELEEELDEELLIHRSSSIYGPLHVRSIDLDVGAGSFNFAVQW